MQDGFDSPPAAPSDFPPDPVIHYHILAWLTLLVIAVVAACVFTLVYKSAEKSVRGRLGDGIDARVKAVRVALEAAAQAKSSDQFELARAAQAALEEHFGRTRALGLELGKAAEGLNKALEGLREEDVKPRAEHAGAAMAHGGTIINIAVGSAQTSALPGSNAHEGSVSLPEKLPDAALNAEAHSELLWRAVQKLFAYWSNMHVVATAFRAAQQQLLHSAAWIMPLEDGIAPDHASGFGFRRRADRASRDRDAKV